MCGTVAQGRREWEGLFLLWGGDFSWGGSVLFASAPPGAKALECYSCVQNADDGCSPQKMKTVKCAPGVEVCTEAVGAVETSEWDLLVLAYPLPAPPSGPRLLIIVPPLLLTLATPTRTHSPFFPFSRQEPGPFNTPMPLGLREVRTEHCAGVR